MSAFENIKAKLGNLRFAKEVAKMQRETEAVGFDSAKKIGLLYDATNPEDFETIKQYVKEVRAHSNILRARSLYFKCAFSSRWVTINNDMIMFKKPNINPTVFGIILK